MVESLLCCVPVARVHLEQHSNKIFCILGNALPISCIETEITQPHFGEHVGISFTVEWRIPAEHHVHDYAKTPQIRSLVVLARQNLRSHVVWCACFGRQDLVRRKLACQSEVDHLQCGFLNGILRGEQEILRLQVAVTDVVFMHVEHGPEHVLHDDGCLNLSKVACVDDTVKKFTTCAQLQDKVDVPVILERFVQLDDVGMVHDLHDGDLLLESIKILHLRFGDGLHSSGDTCGFV
mmetsp:Transcript_58933/g.108011  ORF Transcript_58933/g.108011 Transcript_58933/m.108011 type:complete len:236 (-) Transcript_58933:298-1005(-)